jgi:hypothetical protein
MIQVAIKNGKSIEYAKLPYRRTATGSHEVQYRGEWVEARNIDYTLTIELPKAARKARKPVAATVTYEQWRDGKINYGEKVRRPAGLTEWEDRLYCEKMVKKVTGFRDQIFSRRQLRTGSYEHNRVSSRNADARYSWGSFIDLATCVIKAFSEHGGEWSYAREIIDEAYNEAQYRIELIRG